MSIISGVRDFLKTCPCLSGMPITVDYLADRPTEVAVEGVPVPYILKEYTDGSKLCKYQFTLSARLPWFGDVSCGTANSEKLEEFSQWLSSMTKNRTLPNLGEGKTPISIEATPNRFGYDGKNSSARYQIICSMTYLWEE